MQSESRKVKLKIVNEFGHQEKELTAQEAVTEIQKEVSENGRWLYVDGVYTNTDTLTERDLQRAQSVILANALQGG